MAAGAGFKTFNTGDVLSAADVNTYLMQGVWVFASAAARDAAVTSPQEGNFAYLKDTNVTTYYTGSAWANLDTTGMTNPMTTTGDTIYSSSGSTPARLGIGSTGQVLTVSGGLPVWSSPAAGGGMTLLDTMSLSGSSVTSATFSSAYNQILIYIKGAYVGAENYFHMRLNADTGNNYQYQYILTGIGTNYSAVNSASYIQLGVLGSQSATLKNYYGLVTITRPSDTDAVHIQSKSIYSDATRPYQENVTAVYDNSAAITSVTLFPAASTFSAGSAFIYGVK